VVTGKYPGNLDCGDIEQYVEEGLVVESYLVEHREKVQGVESFLVDA
jgi:hypothetical protein